jgi:endonuclease/exonuclease/phosphatase (EEP) superfamily protein YafD
MLATVEVGGAALSVAATHFQNRRGGAPLVADDADEQLEQLAVVLEALRHRPRPRALLGDLNTAPAVVDPVLAAAGFSVADTRPTAPARAPRLRIDCIAVDGLTIVSSDVVLTAVSDHLAVVVDATL